MIVITGATGALNGSTVDHLLARVPADRIAVVVRDPAKASRFVDLGIEVRVGDYGDDTSSLAATFDGAEQLLLVSSNDPHADAVTLHRNAIDAAVAAGVGRVLYTSHQGAALDTPFKPGRDHAATEAMLTDSGIPWTSLRNGFYAHSLTWMAGPWRDTGVITVPGDGPVSWTSREDSAEAAAAILADGGGYDGPTTITAGAAPTFEEVAAIASEIVGRTVTRVLMDEEEWVSVQVAGGQPEPMARFMLGMYQASAGGYFAGVDPLLGTLLGRAPLSVRDALA